MIDKIFTIFALIFKKPIEIFCKIPCLKYFLPFLMAFINVPCLLCLFVPMWIIFSTAVPAIKGFNHNALDTDPNSKDWNLSSKWAFGIYYVITFFWIIWLILSGCDAADQSATEKFQTLTS